MPDPLIALLILTAVVWILWPTKAQRDAAQARRIAAINREFEQAIQDTHAGPCSTETRRTDVPEVLMQFDVTDPHPDCGHLRGNPVLTDWLAANGVDPMRCRSFRVLADQTVEATYYRVGDDGKYLVDRRGDEVLTEAHTVPLTVPIPPELDVLRDTEGEP